MTKIIDEIYDSTIQLLQQNVRAIPKYTPEMISAIRDEFNNIDLNSLTTEELKKLTYKLLCILANTQTTAEELQEILIKLHAKIVMLKNNSELMVMFLGAMTKQFIDHSSKTGTPISPFILEILKLNLKNNNPEIIEWTLRAIDSMGAQGLRLETEIKNLRPSLLNIFNKHQRTAFEIVDHIEKEWSRLKNEKR